MPALVSQKLMSGRYNGDESKKDIHEKDVEYLQRCIRAATYACGNEGWKTVHCADYNTDTPLSIDEIGERVYDLVKEIL